MTDLAYTEELHHALELVCEQHVVHHAGYCAHPQGWAWRFGGDMTFDLMSQLDALWHAQLINFAQSSDPCGNPAAMTFTGSRRLSTWREEHPKGGVA